MRRQQQDVSGEFKSVNQTALPPRQKLPDQNLTVQQLFQRYPGMYFEVWFIKLTYAFHLFKLECRHHIFSTDYKKSTLKTLAMLDVEKICSDLIERLIEWIVQADHEVWIIKNTNQRCFSFNLFFKEIPINEFWRKEEM